ncbi:MAG: DUF6444 domain-containing protein [Nostoc sp.]
MGASFWYEAYLKQKQENVELEAKLEQVEKELEQLKEKFNKLNLRSSENSSQPPSQDGYKRMGCRCPEFSQSFPQVLDRLVHFSLPSRGETG